MNWKLVVFDLAGTTVEDKDFVARCLDEALRSRGYEAEFQKIVSLMGIPKPVAVRELAPEASDAEVEEMHSDFQDRIIRFYRESPEVREIEGTSDTFRWLKERGILVALDTGFDRPTATTIFDRIPWNGLVDATITSDEVERGRPHPDMILSLMQKLGVEDAALVVKVGDTPSDLNQGTSAGCGKVVGVCQGSHTREQLEPYPHTDLIDSVRDLPALLS